MNAKKSLLVSVLAILIGLAASAQAATLPLVQVENGYGVGYNLGTNAITNSFDFSLAFAVSDAIQASVTFIQGDTITSTYRLMGLSYAVSSKVGFRSQFGVQDPAGAQTAVVGFGLYVNLLGKSVAGSLQTGLKLKVDYLTPLSSYNTGELRVGLGATVGM